MKNICTVGLRRLQKELWNNVYHLNAGGCGEFAYLMGKKLKREGISFQIKVFVREDNELALKKEALEDIRNNRRGFHDTAFRHCFIQVGDIAFDGYNMGEELFSAYAHLKVAEGEYTLTDMFIALKNGNWNETYKIFNSPKVLEDIVDKNIASLVV